MRVTAGLNGRPWRGLARGVALGVRGAIAAAGVILLIGVGSLPAHAADAAYPLRKVMLTSVSGVFGDRTAPRSYSFYMSSKVNPHGYNPVVYALHDNGETVEEFAARSGWSKVAEDYGFVVVYPEAVDKTWQPADLEEDYLKTVFDSVPSNLKLPGPMPGRFFTFNSIQYITGDGAGGAEAQAFAISNPGLFAGLATLNGTAYRNDLAKGDEQAQGYFENQRGTKAMVPVWRPLRKDVPVAAWLLTTGAPDARQIALADYWKRADGVGAAAQDRAVGAFQAAVYANAANPAQEVRATVLPAGARYDEALTSTMWTEFFRRIGRSPDQPNGELFPLKTEEEIDRLFDIHTVQLGDRTYKYYVRTPPGYAKGHPLPVVFLAHGFAFPPWMYMQEMGMEKVAQKEGFITVYFNGSNNAWTPNIPDTPDFTFVNQAIAEVKANYSVDPTRFYMSGFSVGGALTLAEGLTNPRAFAAVAPTSGLEELSPGVMAMVAKAKADGNVRIPMIIMYGAADLGSTVDGQIGATGGVAKAINMVKAFDDITTADRVTTFDSPTTAPYDILVPGGQLTKIGMDVHYPAGRFRRYDYMSADAKPLPLFSFVLGADLMHGVDPREAQMEWDYFKHWRRNADGSLGYVP